MRRHRDHGYLLGSILAGALATTVTYYLYGTKEGEKRRKDIKKAAGKLRDRAAELKNEAKDISKSDIGSLMMDMSGDLGEILKENKDLIKNLDKEALEDLKDRLREHWEEAKEDILDTLEEAEEE